MSHSSRRGALGLVLLALSAAATPAAAQRLSLSPTIGVYIPTTELVKAANGESFKQEVGLAVGGRLGITLSPRFGVETSVSYVPSDLHFNLENGTTTMTDANLLFGTARATVHAIPMTEPVWLTLNGGVSLVKRGGTAYENVEDPTDVGGVVGATVGFRLGSALSFYVAADDYIYGSRFDAAAEIDGTKTQNDVQLAVGFGFPVGR